jgi:hypothetical protein
MTVGRLVQSANPPLDHQPQDHQVAWFPCNLHQQREAIKRVRAGKETLREIARSYDVSRWTIARLPL